MFLGTRRDVKGGLVALGVLACLAGGNMATSGIGIARARKLLPTWKQVYGKVTETNVHRVKNGRRIEDRCDYTCTYEINGQERQCRYSSKHIYSPGESVTLRVDPNAPQLAITSDEMEDNKLNKTDSTAGSIALGILLILFGGGITSLILTYYAKQSILISIALIVGFAGAGLISGAVYTAKLNERLTTGKQM